MKDQQLKIQSGKKRFILSCVVCFSLCIAIVPTRGGFPTPADFPLPESRVHHSLHPSAPQTLFVHLSEINREWFNHQEYFASLHHPVFFESDRERIRCHLLLVEKHLRHYPAVNLSSEQLTNRGKCLDLLHKYAVTGAFPENIFHRERTPYFIDHRGVACAVGHLIIESGHGKIAEKICHESNYAYIRELKFSALSEWASMQGFTLDELAWIQPTYGGGSGGVIKGIPSPLPPPVATTISDQQLLGGALLNRNSINKVVFGLNQFTGRKNRSFKYNESGASDQGTGESLPSNLNATASRFMGLQRSLEISETVSLNGVETNSPGPMEEELVAVSIDDRNSMFSVELPASSGYDPGVIYSGVGWQLVASADFGEYQIDSLAGSPGVDSTTDSATIDFRYQVSDHLILGGQWSHLKSDSEFSDDVSGIEIEGDSVAVYGSYFENNIWGSLFHTYGVYDSGIRRRTVLGNVATANPGIETHQTSFDLGYNCAQDRGKVIHGPTFGLEYTTSRIDGYSESGDPLAGATFSGQAFESLVSRVGWQIHWEKAFYRGLARPQLSIGYGRENLNQDQIVQGSLSNGFTNRISETRLGTDWLEIGAGIDFQVRPNLSLSIGYQGQFLREYTEIHTGVVSVGIDF